MRPDERNAPILLVLRSGFYSSSCLNNKAERQNGPLPILRENEHRSLFDFVIFSLVCVCYYIILENITEQNQCLFFPHQCARSARAKKR